MSLVLPEKWSLSNNQSTSNEILFDLIYPFLCVQFKSHLSKSNYNDTYNVINVSTLSMKPLQINDLYTFVVLLSGSNVAKYLTHSVSTSNNISIEVNF